MHAVRKVVEGLADGRGEMLMVSCIVTAVCGYGKPVIADIFWVFGKRALFVTPENIRQGKPFVASSSLKPLK